MAYLLDGDATRFDAYVKDGMVADRELWNLIERNVQERGGEVLPIEARMRASLTSKFGLAGLQPADIGLRNSIGWPTFESRMRTATVGINYIGYRAGSHSIQGTWNELVTHHLTGGNDFLPKPEWSHPRPQPLFATMIVTGQVLSKYAGHIGANVAVEFVPRFESVVARAIEADKLHEVFMGQHKST